jgi:DNA (cytosine-5)-methyltransferase 1
VIPKESSNGQSAAYAKKLPDARKIFVVDFFAGCGGLSWGFQNTRQSHLQFEILAGIDIDKTSLSTYRSNIDAPAVALDVREIERRPALLSDIVPGFDPLKNRPLVFVGGPPCQGFSAHRKKDERDDHRNSLLLTFARICHHFKPDAVVMENVPEIITGKYSKYFDAAKELLQEDYTLEIGLVDLSLFGVPQRRKRALVMGTLAGEIEPPRPIFTKDRPLTVRHAIAHLLEIRAGQIDPRDPSHKAPSHTERILERIKKTPADGGDRRSLSASEQLACHSSIDKSSTPGFTDVYGRLRWDTPSVTITAKSSTPSCGRFLHPEQDRNISVREAAILQGFPQSYVFEGPLVHRYRQIGEAVPPLFSRFLAWHLLDYFSPREAAANAILSDLRSRHRPSALPPSSDRLGQVDCFCGSGGLSVGFQKAGIDPLFAFDTDSDSVSTFNRNIAAVAEQADIRDSRIARQIVDSVGQRPFILVGGPPCQGFSQQRRGDDIDPRNNLVLRFAQLACTLPRKPLAVVLENVTYLDSPRGQAILQEFVGRIEKSGYRVFRHDLNSADAGLPQLRRRIILVAILSHTTVAYSGPKVATPNRWLTVGEVLSDLMDLPGATLLSDQFNHLPNQEGDLNRRRIAFVDMGKGRMAIPSSLQLPCHTRYTGHLDVYGRLDWFGQARTITGGFDSFTRGEFAHPFFHRSITPREAARIQGFPDWFEFIGNRASVRRQIGNAVPPPLAFIVARAIQRAVSRLERVSSGKPSNFVHV